MPPVEAPSQPTLGHPVLDALHRASRPDVSEAAFEREFLSRLAGVLHASGAAVWFDPGGETLYLRYKRDIPQEDLQRSPEGWKAHGLLLKALANQGEPALIPPGWSERDAGNPTGRELLLAPALVLAGQKIILEVFRDAGVSETRPRDPDLRLVQTAAQFAADRVRAQQVAALMQSQTESKKLDRYAQQVHSSLELEPTAFMIVNEAAALLGCDRVTLAVSRRGDAVVRAVSGQSDVNRRSNLIRLQEKVARGVIANPKPVIVGPRVRQVEPSVDEAVTACLNESGAKTLFAIPLRTTTEQPPTGVLFIEQFDERVTPEQLADRANSVALHASVALQHAEAHDQVFLGSLRRRVGQSLRNSVRLRRLLWWGLVGAVIAALTLVRMPLRMDASGELRAQVRRGVFAPESGTVRQVPVKHGSAVTAGQTLAVLENTELQVQLHQTHEELASATETIKIREVERSDARTPGPRRIQLDGEIAELQERISFLTSRQELLKRRVATLTLPAPISGVIATWEPQRQLQDRPVSAGTLLLTVIDETGPWRLEARLPEVDAGPVLLARQRAKGEPLKVEYLLATHPEQRYFGRLLDVAIRTENLEDQPMIYLVIEPDPQAMPPLRDGAEVRCKIDCGERTLGYVVFRELIEFVQSRVMFLF